MTSNQPLDLDAIEARANAATEGPWCTDSWEIYQGAEYVAGAEWIGETCRGRVDGLAQDRADAAFVAAARTDVPALVAEVRRLRAELAASRTAALTDASDALKVHGGTATTERGLGVQWAADYIRRMAAAERTPAARSAAV